MKMSELKKLVEELEQKHGDIEVCFRMDRYTSYEVEKAELKEGWHNTQYLEIEV